MCSVIIRAGPLSVILRIPGGGRAAASSGEWWFIWLMKGSWLVAPKLCSLVGAKFGRIG